MSPGVFLFLLLLVTAIPGRAQVLSGNLSAAGAAGNWLVLKAALGGTHEPVDSVRIGPDGAFLFKPSLNAGAGFFQLVLHDSDRVDIILSSREPRIAVRFDGMPLQQLITVLESTENTLLWRYKTFSRECGAVLEAVRRERAALDPMDIRRLASLDSIERHAVEKKESRFRALAAEAPSSYFTRVLLTSTAVDGAIQQGPHAVSAAFDFGDPDLLRSSIYDKAVMAFLQSINVVSEDQLTNAADTLIRLASADAGCLAYMVEHLVDLFSVYGPQSTLQHIVDVHLAKEPPTVPLTPRLAGKVKDLLAVSIGSIGADVPLMDTLGTTRPLSQMLVDARLCAMFFYSSTCDHCHAQMPGMARLYAEYRSRGFTVVGIALDDDRSMFKANIEQRGLRFPCFSEFNGWGSIPAKAYAVKATPTIILVDKDLRIVAKPYDSVALEKELAQRLK